MIQQPPPSTRTDALCPYSTLCRSEGMTRGDAQAREHAERRQPVERPAGIGAVHGLEALHERAQDDALRDRGDDGAEAEGPVPDRLAALRLEEIGSEHV